MSILTDIKELLLSLRLVDIVFFIAVLVLMILIITLIYFIKINKDEIEKEEKLGETAEMKIARELEKAKSSDDMIKFTDYEKEQEDKAIISYDELLNKNKGSELNYEKEEKQDDLTVKKIDLENIVKTDEVAVPKLEVRVISFEREEAFLEALKTLEKGLG